MVCIFPGLCANFASNCRVVHAAAAAQSGMATLNYVTLQRNQVTGDSDQGFNIIYYGTLNWIEKIPQKPTFA